ncbi:MAG: alpha-hydroxy-acid oxidizing protein [Hyphomicrobiaceae bacterium]|nr:alpha-hydroxy-acid oxidizing protein [Hyphomicrobiaceae bacterium]
MAEENTFEVMHEFVEPARKNISKGSWDYLMGAAETETTHRRNRLALDSIAFRPRVLRDVVDVDCGTEFLGHRLRLPVILAPIGSMQDFVEGGGAVPTRAAARFGCMHMLSSVCAPGVEAVAKAAENYPKIFQIYVRGDADWVDDLVAQALECNYSAVCFTVDLDYYGRRERDKAKRYQPTARRHTKRHDDQRRFAWADIERIRGKFDCPLIIKGIATVEDALIAADTGIDVVYVSNHGGRQLDHGLGSAAVLQEIVEALDGRSRTIVDGAFLRGTDIVKAMALGADAVGIGRLQGLAAAAAGEDGVVRMLELLENEIEGTLGMLGVTSYKELDTSYLADAPVPFFGGWHPAFPLIDEGY